MYPVQFDLKVLIAQQKWHHLTVRPLKELHCLESTFFCIARLLIVELEMKRKAQVLMGYIPLLLDA